MWTLRSLVLDDIMCEALWLVELHDLCAKQVGRNVTIQPVFVLAKILKELSRLIDVELTQVREAGRLERTRLLRQLPYEGVGPTEDERKVLHARSVQENIWYADWMAKNDILLSSPRRSNPNRSSSLPVGPMWHQ